MNVRCLSFGLPFILPLLAVKDNGVSQQLNIIKGVDIESDARMKDSLCQEAVQ